MNSIRHGRELGQPRVRRHRLSIADGNTPPPPLSPPRIDTPPALALSSDGNSLLYTFGVWIGNPTPTVTRTLNVAGVGTFPAEAVMPIQPEWRGRTANVSESAINSQGGPMVTQTSPVAIPAAPPSLDSQVEAILAGTKGFALDIQDLSSLFQDAAGTIPVTAAGQPVGLVKGKWGTTPQDWSQTSAAARPVLEPDGMLLFDGADDFLNVSPNSIFQNVPAIFCCGRLKTPAGAGGLRTFLHVSGNATGTPRLRFLSQVDGSLDVSTTRIGTSTLTASTPAATLTPDVAQTVTGLTDYATAGRSRVWVDGTLQADIASNGGGQTEDVASSVGRLMRFNTATNPGKGSWGRMVFAVEALSDADRAVIEQWVGGA
jgi:hypothetical protein